MSNELLDELMAIKAKARLTQATDHRFTRLEEFIACKRYLDTYTQKEKDRLLAQFDQLSEQEKQTIWNNATQRTSSGFFHLTDQDREKLESGKKELSFHERARISDGYINTAVGSAWFDLGELSEAIIEIDDSSTPEREKRPYAYISFSTGYHRRVETIDIFESIKANPASIGHPAIIFAIYHWQSVIYTRRVIERDDIAPRSKWEQELKDEFHGRRDLKNAERNLKAISNTMYVAARNRAISREAALAIKMDWYGLRVEDEKTALHQAWKILGEEEIKLIAEKDEVLAEVEGWLRRPGMHTDEYRLRRISIEKVMEFLRDKGRKGGRRLVGYNKSGISLRPSWKVFRNAFAAWFFGLKQSMVQDYLEKAAKQEVADKEIYEPTVLPPQTTLPRIWHYVLVTPLVAVQAPIWVREDDLGFNGITDAIKTVTSKAANEAEGN